MSQEGKAEKIISLCEKHWANYQMDCSGFVRKVAADLGLSITGQANDIVEQLGSLPWNNCRSGVEARDKAIEGYFVVGGLKATPNGHVVVVTKGPLAHGKYPTAYWGSLGGIGRKKTTINWSWNRNDRDNVVYAYREFER